MSESLKISELSPSGSLSGPELIVGVQSGGNVKITADQLKTFIGGGGGGGGGGGQLKIYTADPNGESIVPDDITKPALAYSDDGTGPLYTWSVATQTWK